MVRKIFERGCNNAFSAFQEFVPNIETRGSGYYINKYGHRCKCSTGNMAFNASKIEFPYRGLCKIYIDENVAPYVPYTNEKWISPKWKGKKNPNEDWFGRATWIVAKSLAQQFRGTARRAK